VEYYWKVVARNAAGQTESLPPAKRFRIDPALPSLAADELSEFGEGPDGLIVAADLAGDPKPLRGRLVRAEGHRAAAGPDGKPGGAIQLDGQRGGLVYALRAFPGRDFTLSLWMAYDRKEDRLGQVVSAWDHGMDDPLRLSVAGGKLSARIEAGANYATDGIALEPATWHHVAVVKTGPRLVLYLDGKPAARMPVPEEIHSAARDFALGANPHFTGVSEHLACRVARMAFYARALTDQEIVERAKK
jgi:hypothetical protein